jgi:hypothetical protein|tara:strand:+ start:83166 stop:83375 length:210 start_codon:yes stop_codon:yes gene_type:complete
MRNLWLAKPEIAYVDLPMWMGCVDRLKAFVIPRTFPFKAHYLPASFEGDILGADSSLSLKNDELERGKT